MGLLTLTGMIVGWLVDRLRQKTATSEAQVVDPGSPGKPGTGLGLFITRSIAEAHGGAVEVSSAPDSGATFTLVLPVGSTA